MASSIEEVEMVAKVISVLLIDGAIEVDPLAFDFDVGFIHRHESPTGRA